jgi:hypothetical protein
MTTLQQYQEDTLKKFDEKFPAYLYGERGDYTQAPIPTIKSFLLSSLKGQLEVVGEIIEKERDTWAKESIGDKALQSLESALSTSPLLEQIQQLSTK